MQRDKKQVRQTINAPRDDFVHGVHFESRAFHMRVTMTPDNRHRSRDEDALDINVIMGTSAGRQGAVLILYHCCAYFLVIAVVLI